MAVLALAACGSDDDEPVGAGGGGGGSESSGDDQVTAARARVEEALAEPTEFIGREPLSEVPEPGKELIFLRCSLPVCSIIAAAFQDAAAVLDWKAEIIDFSSTDPESVIAAMNQAVDAAPDGIAITGLPISAFEEPLARAQKAGIPVSIGAVADVEVGGMDGNGVVGLSSGPATVLAAAYMVGDYMIADSEGEANVA
ncbi:MAG: hypothetical protein AB7L84_16740, partial [Acidimicrobiia bacterium]